MAPFFPHATSGWCYCGLPATESVSLISAAGSQHRVITLFSTQPEETAASRGKDCEQAIKTAPESKSLNQEWLRWKQQWRGHLPDKHPPNKKANSLKYLILTWKSSRFFFLDLRLGQNQRRKENVLHTEETCSEKKKKKKINVGFIA